MDGFLNSDFYAEGGIYPTTKLGVGTTAVPHGGVGAAMGAVDGANASTSGPHWQFTTASDDYPLMQILNWQHDDVRILFDAYYDGAYKSSDAGSNFALIKTADEFRIGVDDSVAQGGAVTLVSAFVCDKNGIITKPLQSAFMAYLNADATDVTGNGTLYTVVFNAEKFDQNSDFNTGTGVFTAPVTGHYFFHTSVRPINLGATTDYVGTLVIGGTSAWNYELWHIDPTNIDPAGGAYLNMNGTCFVPMTAGDTAHVAVVCTGVGADTVDIDGNAGTGITYFGGWLVC